MHGGKQSLTELPITVVQPKIYGKFAQFPEVVVVELVVVVVEVVVGHEGAAVSSLLHCVITHWPSSVGQYTGSKHEHSGSAEEVVDVVLVDLRQLLFGPVVVLVVELVVVVLVVVLVVLQLFSVNVHANPAVPSYLQVPWHSGTTVVLIGAVVVLVADTVPTKLAMLIRLYSAPR